MRPTRLVAASLVAHFLGWAMVVPAGAQSNTPAGPPSLQVPRLAQALTLADLMAAQRDGHLDGLALAGDFTQRTPSDGAPASERTHVYLGYDDAHLYVGFVAFDRSPERLRARLTRREAIVDDDQVSVMLDTFQDRRRAFLFSANPLGVQHDALWSEGEGLNDAFDTVWRSEGRITGGGYVVLFSLPFSSLRFPATDRQTWNVVLGRAIPRANEVAYWPPISSRQTGFLGQAAPLEGLAGISPGRSLQLIPYGSYRAFRALDARDVDAPRLVSRVGDMGIGVDAKMVLRDSLAVDVTVNPDFSQVESDDPQVTANQRFELFFPEKRPFFLENAHFFDTPIDNLVFTRRIADPQFGARLTGKLGPYALGAFLIDDQAPGRRLPEGDRLADSRALFGVARVSRDILGQSTVSFLFTGRQYRGASNRLAGVDGRFRWARNWTLEYQAVGSATRSVDGERRAGQALDVELEYAGRQLFYVTEYNDRSPEFEAAAGFVPRTDFRRLENSFRYRFRPEGPVLIAWGPQLFSDRLWSHDGVRLDWGIRPGLGVELTGRTFLAVDIDLARERLRPQEFAALGHPVDFSRNRVRVSGSTAFLRALGLAASAFWGDDINLDPPDGLVPTPSSTVGGRLAVTLHPTRAIRWDTSYLAQRLDDRASSRRIFDTSIVRSRLNWQFTRALALRVIVQRDATDVQASLTRLERRRNLNVDLLVTYLVNPWTAFHVGYNGNRQNLALRPTERGAELVRTSRGLIDDGRQVFVKVSYLWRR